MKSSETSAKYSWPRREQKLEIQDSGVPEEEDIIEVIEWVPDRVEVDASGDASVRFSSPASKDESPLADTMEIGETWPPRTVGGFCTQICFIIRRVGAHGSARCTLVCFRYLRSVA